MSELKPQFQNLNSATRMHGIDIPIIGLTGGIATGKSTVSKIFVAEGFPVVDADRLVKNVYEQNETRDFVKANFPLAWKNDSVHFPTLREIFFKDPAAKAQIEQYIYQRLPGAFREAVKALGDIKFVIYDVPLLYEKQLDKLVDVKVVVYAPYKIQKARLMDRDDHLEDMAEQIIAHQMDIEEKKLKADFVIDNSWGVEELAEEVEQFLRQVLV